MEIIEAEEQHISAMQQIYARHVVNGSASFETAAPDREEMLARLNKTRSAGLPWFVILEEDRERLLLPFALSHALCLPLHAGGFYLY